MSIYGRQRHRQLSNRVSRPRSNFGPCTVIVRCIRPAPFGPAWANFAILTSNPRCNGLGWPDERRVVISECGLSLAASLLYANGDHARWTSRRSGSHDRRRRNAFAQASKTQRQRGSDVAGKEVLRDVVLVFRRARLAVQKYRPARSFGSFERDSAYYFVIVPRSSA